MTLTQRFLGALLIFTCCLGAVADASDQQIVYIRNTCECWSVDLKCVCKIESDPTSVRPLMQRLVNRTAEYYWQEIEFQSMVYDRTTFILANTFADGPFPSGITFKGDFSIVNDSFNHLNMTLNKVELNFETFSGRKPKFSKQYWRYIFDHGEGTLRSLRIIKYQIEDFIIPNYLGAALTQEVRPLTEFKVVGCEVKEVKERAFKNFTHLEVLDLSDNHLTTLPENVFSRNINLQKILLANNQISFLTKTIFDGLPNLLLINLRKNKLTAVPAIPRHTNRRFQPMVYLMADNSIHCRCSLIWVLHELTFHHNLEIEATCSDPTMVRGMPIIEGFTRMDKEACYRLIRKETDEAQTAPEERRLAGPTSSLMAASAAAAVAAPETSAEIEAVRSAQGQSQLNAKSGGEQTNGINQVEDGKKSALGQSQDKSNVVAQFAQPSQSAVSETQSIGEQHQHQQQQQQTFVQTVANQVSANHEQQQHQYAPVHDDGKPQTEANSLALLLTQAYPKPTAEGSKLQSQVEGANDNHRLASVEPNQVVQAPGSSIEKQTAQVATKQTHAQVAPEPSAISVQTTQQQQQQHQLVNVAPQTVLTPAQPALLSPVAAFLPAGESTPQQTQQLQSVTQHHQLEQHSVVAPAPSSSVEANINANANAKSQQS